MVQWIQADNLRQRLKFSTLNRALFALAAWIVGLQRLNSRRSDDVTSSMESKSTAHISKWSYQNATHYVALSYRRIRTKLKKTCRKRRPSVGSSNSDSSGYRGVQYTEVSNLTDIDHFRGLDKSHARAPLHIVNGSREHSSSESSGMAYSRAANAGVPELDTPRDSHPSSTPDHSVSTSHVHQVPALILDIDVDPSQADIMVHVIESGRVAQRRRLRRTQSWLGPTSSYPKAAQ